MKTMKLTNKFAATAFAALALVFATSCSTEEEDDTTTTDTTTTTTDNDADSNELKSLTEDLTLEASKKYVIKSVVEVPAGKTLTINEGVEITADAGENYIVVQKGGKIIVKGTAAKPVIMKGNGVAGDWGGLMICGKANTTEGASAATEVGNYPYGGSEAADNSGSIEYLIIKDSGYNVDKDRQFNGLSLYAVGSSTKVDNVALINGKDDGIEFFGGTVNASNIYTKNNIDDQIDWTEGWKGSLTNVVAEFDDNFEYSTIVEADGKNVTEFPTVTNLVATNSKGIEGTAFQFKQQSNATFTKVTLTGGFETLFKLSGDVALSDISVNGAAANESGTYDAGTATDFSWVK